MTHEWNSYQTAVFRDMAEGTGHTAVIARAGVGKTTVIAHGVDGIPRNPILVCAFDTGSAAALTQKVVGAECRTLHSLGWLWTRTAWRRIQLDFDKGKNIAFDVVRAAGRSPVREWAHRVGALASHAKNTLAASVEDIEALAVKFALDSGLEHQGEQRLTEVLALLAVQALEAALADTTKCDFDDQLYLPIRYQLEPRERFAAVIVDETQDMNAAQLWLARRALLDDGRLIIVGDDRQAIYGWRGADADGVHRMIRELDAKTLKMPVTYRCARRIVRLAKEIVPDLEAAPNAEEGTIRDATKAVLEREAQPGDYVLSRKNAPLVTTALRFAQQGKRAVIAGKDLSTQLFALVTRSGAPSLAEFETWLATYSREQQKKLIDSGRDEQADDLADRASALFAICDTVSDLNDLKRRLEFLFDPGDKDRPEAITLSSIHRAKGRERDRVWILADTLRAGKREEDNLRYVAITRAKRELIFVR